MTSVKTVANPLKELHNFGQSAWLDYIRRSLLTSGELKRLVEEDGLGGVTSNPAIFEKAIAGSSDYDDLIKSAGSDNAEAVFWKLAIRDIQDAADVLKPVYTETKGRDGYVSLEVSPLLAADTERTITEARRLWKEVGRDNVMIKVPATPEGVPAIRTLIGEGININVTLLFSQEAYRSVAEAYIAGLEDYAGKGGDLKKVGSVASFFISRIDSMIDKIAEDRLKSAKSDEERRQIESIIGKVAIANGKLAYQIYLEVFGSDKWKALAAKGAQTQRVLWASTSTKNPKYPDTLYVDELIGPDTVNTIPPATFDAFRDHGRPRTSLTEGLDDARKVMETLEKVGISMKKVTADLIVQGVDLFADAFKQLLDTLEKQCKVCMSKAVDRITYKLPADLEKSVKAALAEWQKEGKMPRLWARDAALWTGSDESKWLDWLSIVDDQLAHVDRLTAFAKEVKDRKFSHVLLLGMGGSSLCPEVMAITFGKQEGFPELHVLDSTDPAQVKTREKQIDVAKTLFIVSSKSGSTLEPNIFWQYFWDAASKARGTDKVGDQFVAVTDPGSKLEALAKKDGFWHIFPGVPGIGGRYSALSNFGMVPAAAMGVDVQKFLNVADEMVEACQASVPVEENPGAVLGAIMGVLAKGGRDKVTLKTSPAVKDLGAWLEQLLAESTGKEGHGLIPVDRENLAPPAMYGKDRLLVYLRLESDPCTEQDKLVGAIEGAGVPTVRIAIPDIYHLGQEFFRWEIATAVAGSIIGINAFNQPDVEASKIVTKELTTAYEKSGSLPSETPFFDGDGVKLFTDKKNEEALLKAAGTEKSLVSYLRAHLGRIKEGDYFAVLGYVEMNADHEAELQKARHKVRDAKKVATCLGFGPRFLHSTGQAYKGGPNSGVFLQITCDDAADLPVPGQSYTFGVVKAAQARGDFQVLAERGRRALRVHIGKDVKAGLASLNAAIEKALG